MMRKFTITILFLVLFTKFSISQVSKETQNIKQVWVGYLNQTRFSNHWGSWLDLHLRTKEDFTKNFSQAVFRLGLTYYFTDNTSFTAGYAYMNHFPADNHKYISQPEHRPWQQIVWIKQYPRIKTTQRFRLEERFKRKIATESQLADGYGFNYRLRYNFLMNIPLGKRPFAPNTLAFVINDEVHVNFGKEIIYNYFDQNRFFLGFAFQVNKHDNLQFGYMNVFQQLDAGNKYKSIHALRIFYFHNLDLR